MWRSGVFSAGMGGDRGGRGVRRVMGKWTYEGAATNTVD